MTDMFSSLPPELRLEVLVHLKSKSNIFSLIMASPSMLAQYRGSKGRIQRAVLKAEFCDDLLQDAVAVALFPKQADPLPQADIDELQRHVQRWSRGQLPDPFRPTDPAAIGCLDRLYHRLTAYIEDYITKATSEYPPRAYMALPDLSSKRGRLLFRNKEIGIKTITMDSLSRIERRRLLQAFLKYELFCKINLLERGASRRDWGAWAAYEKLPCWEREAIRCVHNYIKDLYGAAFAHAADSWLPDIPHTLVTEADGEVLDDGLRFPDNVWFSAEAYRRDTDALSELPSFVRTLALTGLDPITALLTFPRDQSGCPQQLIPWLRGIFSRYEGRLGLQQGHFSSRLNNSVNLCSRMDWEGCSAVCQALRTKLPGQRVNNSMFANPHSALQRSIYRQRAWVFFDDSRLYPRQDLSRHFPTVPQLRQQPGARLWPFHSVRDERSAALHRKRTWHEERQGWYMAGVDREDGEEADTDLGNAQYERRFLAE